MGAESYDGAGQAATRPEAMSTNPFRVIAADVIHERRTRKLAFPPGPADFDFARTRRMAHDPLPILLSLYEQNGPIFSVRILHRRMVWMLGPEANHYITVTHPENFLWREGSFGDLIPLLGDGLLTIDGAYHDRARRIMMPAFHRKQIEAAVDAMAAETESALAALRPGETIDIYDWMRNLAMRIAMRALLGLDPDDAGKGAAAAEHFERALGFYGTEFQVRLLRGPRSPWRNMLTSRKVLDEIVYGEIAHRREHPDPERRDILSLLIEARDEGGDGFSDDEIRDQVMTLMFAGHDTSTSTLTFLVYELARHPDALARLHEEQDRVLAGASPTPEQLEHELPYLEMVLDEVLRLYPPAWVGPRRSVRDYEWGGYRVPAGTYVQYSLVGQPPDSRGLPRSRGVHPRALHPRA